MRTRPAPPASQNTAVVSVQARAPSPALVQGGRELTAPARSLPPDPRKLATEPFKSPSSAAQGPSESRLLEQARRLLNRNPTAALAITDQTAELFPSGVLLQEREVIAISALRRLNRTTEAARRAAAFSKAFPGSVHERVIEDTSPK